MIDQIQKIYLYIFQFKYRSKKYIKVCMLPIIYRNRGKYCTYIQVWQLETLCTRHRSPIFPDIYQMMGNSGSRYHLQSLDTHLAVAVQRSVYPAVCLQASAEEGSGIGIDALPFTHLPLEGGSGAPRCPHHRRRLQMMMMMMMALTVIVCCGHFHVEKMELGLLWCAFNLHARCARAAFSVFSLAALLAAPLETGGCTWPVLCGRLLLLSDARLFQIIIYCYYATVQLFVAASQASFAFRSVLAKLMATLIHYHNNNFLAILALLLCARVCPPPSPPTPIIISQAFLFARFANYLLYGFHGLI